MRFQAGRLTGRLVILSLLLAAPACGGADTGDEAATEAPRGLLGSTAPAATATPEAARATEAQQAATPTSPAPTATPVPPTATAPPPTATAVPPTPVPAAPTATPNPRAGCSPAYPTVCIPPPPPDLDCKDIPFRRFKVLAPDPHRLDGSDNDGIGCES